MKFAFFHSLGLISALMTVPFARSAKICFLLYQMADNDLEYFIMQDLAEYSASPLIKSTSVTSWIFFDHRNFRNDDEDIRTPLPFVFNKDGSAQVGTKPQGSFYFKQDHALGKLVIEESLGEVNGDDPETVRAFASRGLADCKANGAEEYMIVFSSHGTGFAGFGGDENIRNRKLVQTNANIVGALRSALDDNLGVTSKFDVIGFDACLMQAFGAADDYSSVARFLLASEEVEPGTGKITFVLSKPKQSVTNPIMYLTLFTMSSPHWFQAGGIKMLQ